MHVHPEPCLMQPHMQLCRDAAQQRSCYPAWPSTAVPWSSGPSVNHSVGLMWQSVLSSWCFWVTLSILKSSPRKISVAFKQILGASPFSVLSCVLPGHTRDCLEPGFSLLLLEHYATQQGSDFLQELP